MCLCKLRNILFPTNIIGLNKRSVSFAVADGRDDITLEIVWSGKRLECAYTTELKGGEQHHRVEVITPYHEIWKDGNEDEQTIYVRRSVPLGYCKVVGNKFYFNATGVTSLVVNGQTLI